MGTSGEASMPATVKGMSSDASLLAEQLRAIAYVFDDVASGVVVSPDGIKAAAAVYEQEETLINQMNDFMETAGGDYCFGPFQDLTDAVFKFLQLRQAGPPVKMAKAKELDRVLREFCEEHQVNYIGLRLLPALEQLTNLFTCSFSKEKAEELRQAVQQGAPDLQGVTEAVKFLPCWTH
jgi:hypothetical protein